MIGKIFAGIKKTKAAMEQIKKFRKVGIVGMPPLEIIADLNHAGVEIIDLDTPLIRADIELTTPYLPRVYCAILRTVILNCLHMAVDAVFIDTGPGKCDCALHVATVLEDMLAVPVYRTKNGASVP